MHDTDATHSGHQAVQKTRQLMEDHGFCDRHRTSPKHFTRQRRLTFVNTVVFLLQKTLRSIQTHLHAFFESLGQWSEAVTASAWCQARLKLGHTAFIELNEEAVIQTLYAAESGSFAVRRWNGFRVLAIDTSLVRLPNTQALGQEFGWVGCSNERGRYGRFPQARLSCLTDVLNRIALQTFFVPWEEGERQVASRHLARMEASDLAILDRGFAGYELFAQFVQAGRHFVCRCPTSSFGAVNALFKANVAGQSRQVPLQADRHHKEALRQAGLPEVITVRLVTVRLPTGELEVLATNLLDEERYPTECFAELYYYRWNVETYYGLLKGRLDLENFTGLSPEAVRQDVYATVFVSNLETILTRPVNEQLAEPSRALKHRQQVNHAVGFHALKSQAVALLLSRRPVPEVVAKLERLFLANPTVVRPGRQVPRRKHSDCRSYHYQRNIRKAVY